MKFDYTLRHRTLSIERMLTGMVRDSTYYLEPEFRGVSGGFHERVDIVSTNEKQGKACVLRSR